MYRCNGEMVVQDNKNVYSVAGKTKKTESFSSVKMGNVVFKSLIFGVC